MLTPEIRTFSDEVQILVNKVFLRIKLSRGTRVIVFLSPVSSSKCKAALLLDEVFTALTPVE